MAGPRSFFDAVATFEPYNQHFVQDIGAFQIGPGTVLLLAALQRGSGSSGIRSSKRCTHGLAAAAEESS